MLGCVGPRALEATRRYIHFHCQGYDISPAKDGPKEAYVPQYWAWKILAAEGQVPKGHEASESCVLAGVRGQGFLSPYGSYRCLLALLPSLTLESP